MTVEEQIRLYEECEREGVFDRDVMPYSVDDMLRIDGEYEYLCTRFYERVGHFFLFLLATVFWRPALYFSLGFRIRGKKNRRGVKGAISVSNHVHPLDCVMMHGLSPFTWKVYHTGAPFNMKKGIRGALIKGLNYLPLSTSFHAQKNFRNTIEDRVKKGNIVHFYPEQALWIRYEKVRPFKPGAFKYAAKFSVPILPAFISFEETPLRRLLHMKKRAILNILPPIYPDSDKSERENAAAMQAACEKSMKDAYQRIYGKKMELDVRESSSVEA